ncbi:hypothetical protein ACSBR2_015987 [Camellia fascicularis]
MEMKSCSSTNTCLMAASMMRAHMNWSRRLNIINGIARGMLYLYEDCRLRIIHRDLKPSIVTTRKGGKKHGTISDGASPVAKNGFLRRQITTVANHGFSDGVVPVGNKNARVGDKCISISDGWFYRRQNCCFQTSSLHIATANVRRKKV